MPTKRSDIFVRLNDDVTVGPIDRDNQDAITCLQGAMDNDPRRDENAGTVHVWADPNYDTILTLEGYYLSTGTYTS